MCCSLDVVGSPVRQFSLNAMVRMFVFSRLSNPYVEILIPKGDGIRRWGPSGGD